MAQLVSDNFMLILAGIFSICFLIWLFKRKIKCLFGFHVWQEPKITYPIGLRTGSHDLSLLRFKLHLDGCYRSYPKCDSLLREALSR